MTLESPTKDSSIRWIAFAGCVLSALAIWTLAPNAFAVTGRVFVPLSLGGLIGADRAHNVSVMAALLLLAVPFAAAKAFLLWRRHRNSFAEARELMYEQRRKLRSDLRRVLLNRTVAAALGVIAMIGLVSKRTEIDGGWLSLAIGGTVCFLVVDFLADSLKYGPMIRYTKDLS